MPMQFCGEPGCGVLVPSGKCVTHTRTFRNARPAYPGERWYDTARWARLRMRVIQDDPFCRHCRAHGVKRLTTDVDHIVKHNGDPVLFWDRRNLQGLCKGCHTIKTSRGE